MVDIIGNVVELVTQIAGIAASDPLSGILVLFGALFMGVSMLAFAYLTLGAVVDLVTPEKSRAQSPKAR